MNIQKNETHNYVGFENRIAILPGSDAGEAERIQGQR